MSQFPYEDRYEVNRRLPAQGRPRAEILAELHEIAKTEDAFWETGKCSGTMYCGDHEHYDYLTEAFGLFAHVNALQRDMCPSVTKFEAEIISMTLGMFHSEVVSGSEPAGLVTTGGTGSIAHAMLAYREHGRHVKGIERSNVIKPETAHPAFDKACHLFGIELRPRSRGPGEYPGGCRLGRRPHRRRDGVRHRIGLQLRIRDDRPHRSAIRSSSRATCRASRGRLPRWVHTSVRPGARRAGACVRLPATGSHDHFGGHTQVRIRPEGDVGAQLQGQGTAKLAVLLPDGLDRGKYCSPGMEGSRSAGSIAATWASMVYLGRSGYLRYAGEIFVTAAKMLEAVRSHPELRVIGDPTFLFSFKSDQSTCIT